MFLYRTEGGNLLPCKLTTWEAQRKNLLTDSLLRSCPVMGGWELIFLPLFSYGLGLHLPVDMVGILYLTDSKHLHFRSSLWPYGLMRSALKTEPQILGFRLGTCSWGAYITYQSKPGLRICPGTLNPYLLQAKHGLHTLLSPLTFQEHRLFPMYSRHFASHDPWIFLCPCPPSQSPICMATSLTTSWEIRNPPRAATNKPAFILSYYQGSAKILIMVARACGHQLKGDVMKGFPFPYRYWSLRMFRLYLAVLIHKLSPRNLEVLGALIFFKTYF